MCSRCELPLSSLVNKLAGDEELDDLYEEAREASAGPDRSARRALRTAEAVLLTLRRYGHLVAQLAGPDGAAVVERERGRWQELLDATRVRLAHGEPVVVYAESRRA
jgi:hypothetical protein